MYSSVVIDNSWLSVYTHLTWLSTWWKKAGTLKADSLQQNAFKFCSLSTKCCTCNHQIEAAVMLSQKLRFESNFKFKLKVNRLNLHFLLQKWDLGNCFSSLIFNLSEEHSCQSGNWTWIFSCQVKSFSHMRNGMAHNFKPWTC